MNNDLIRRVDALKEITKVCCYNGDWLKNGIGTLVSNGEVAHRLNQIPAVDAEPVVRCRDCLNIRWHGIEKNIPTCYEYGGIISPDDFCSRAKRKQEPEVQDVKS